MRCRNLVMPLLSTLLWACPAAAQAPAPKPEPAANAALQYWQAFALLPDLDKEQERLLVEWRTTPLDQKARDLLAKADNSLMYLHRAAKLSHCDWGLDYRDGISMQLPHLVRSRTLARLAALRARQAFERGDWKSGRADATALMALARHIARDPFLVCMVLSHGIEGVTVDLVAPYLPAFKAPPQAVAAMYEALPKGTTLRQAVLAEKVLVESIIRQLREAEQKKQGGWRDMWKALCSGSDIPEAIKGVESLDRAVKLMGEILPMYDELAKVVALPRGEFEREYPEFVRKAKAGSQVAQLLLPSMDKIVATEHRNQARMAMLLAAVAVIHDGPDKLKESKDPFGTGPFEYRALDKGFELKSKLLYEGQPVTLTIGQRPKG
jgi:hypothetical protein